MEKREFLHNTTIITGAGASSASGVPMTYELSDLFLKTPRRSTLPQVVQREMSTELEAFWRDVFSWKWRRDRPSFEDHFTSLDLAANTGHNLGSAFDPARLRVIRRFSIHRAFEILRPRQRDAGLSTLLQALLHMPQGNTVISLNWDTAIEEELGLLGREWDYGIPIKRVGPELLDHDDRPLEFLKLHGSRNWFYCDSCRRIYFGEPSSDHTVDQSGILLRVRDFQRVDAGDAAISALKAWKRRERIKCDDCRIDLSARVATFSYSKALGFFQFDAVWDRALRALCNTTRWIFVGYSLPDADFQVRHLLKTAQLTSNHSRRPEIEVVLGGDRAAEGARRYERFFGEALGDVHLDGLDDWVSYYLAKPSA